MQSIIHLTSKRSSLQLLRVRGLKSSLVRFHEEDKKSSNDEEVDPKSHFYPNTSFGIKERSIKADGQPAQPLLTPFPPFPDGKNPKTGEVGGPAGPEPTVFGDWQRKGRVTDF